MFVGGVYYTLTQLATNCIDKKQGVGNHHKHFKNIMKTLNKKGGDILRIVGLNSSVREHEWWN